jgi:hypothetical protein
MNKWLCIAVLFSCQVCAAEWTPIKWGEDTLREIDTSSITRNGSLATFVARHTFADSKDYKVGRVDVKYLQISLRADCALRTLAQLETGAYDEHDVLISKQAQLPVDNVVTPDSMDESMLNFICMSGGLPAK